MAAPFPELKILKDYMQNSKKHKAYDDTVNIFKSLFMHANKEFPTKLIFEQRPFESWEIFLYRKKIYKSKTSNPIKRVLNSLGKIRRSQDWAMKWPENKNTSILDEETLQKYCENNYPGHTSLTNWAFNVLLYAQGIDPNCYVGVWPQSFELASESDYFKPVAIIFSSEQVLYPPDKGDYCVLKSSDKVDITDANGNKLFNEGAVYYVITPDLIVRYEQVDLQGGFNAIEYDNPFGVIPVFKIKGVVKEQKDNTIIQESRLDPMVHSLDEAAREYSDLQATKVQHAFPLFWYIDTQDCKQCNGTGQVLPGRTNASMIPGPNGVPLQGNPTLPPGTIPIGGSTPVNPGYTPAVPQVGVPAVCRNCNGTGKIRFSPYMSMAIKPAALNQQNVPTPPAGYVQRDVETIKYLDESVKSHLYDALASVNFQFLDQTPLNISGKGKEVDREELNNFVYSFAEDLIATLDSVVFWINEWRYYTRVPSVKDRRMQLPNIPVPQNFDLLPSEYLIDELSKARQSALSPILLQAVEADYAAKKFYNNKGVSEMLQAVYDLDPMPGTKDDMKMIRVQNGGVTKEDYIISCNIEAFVKRAMKEDGAFFKLTWQKQTDIMKRYAMEKLNEMSAKAAVLQAVQPTGFPTKSAANPTDTNTQQVA